MNRRPGQFAPAKGPKEDPNFNNFSFAQETSSPANRLQRLAKMLPDSSKPPTRQPAAFGARPSTQTPSKPPPMTQNSTFLQSGPSRTGFGRRPMPMSMSQPASARPSSPISGDEWQPRGHVDEIDDPMIGGVDEGDPDDDAEDDMMWSGQMVQRGER